MTDEQRAVTETYAVVDAIETYFVLDNDMFAPLVDFRTEESKRNITFSVPKRKGYVVQRVGEDSKALTLTGFIFSTESKPNLRETKRQMLVRALDSESVVKFEVEGEGTYEAVLTSIAFEDVGGEPSAYRYTIEAVEVGYSDYSDHSNISHLNSTPHNDYAHSDHSDHTDSGHTDHSDHSNEAHSDSYPHNDSHSDSHTDWTNGTHSDYWDAPPYPPTHGDWTNAHSDTHSDVSNPHTDEYAHGDHTDTIFRHINWSNVHSHGDYPDTHADGPTHREYTDYIDDPGSGSHNEVDVGMAYSADYTDHSDTHTDYSDHSDVSHSDTHSNWSDHSDTEHEDYSHDDISHSDWSDHQDFAHSDWSDHQDGYEDWINHSDSGA